MGDLERSARTSKLGDSSLETSSGSKRFSRRREASVCAADTSRNSRKFAARPSPIPGRWTRARKQRETASSAELESDVAIPMTTQSMPHPLLAAKRKAAAQATSPSPARGVVDLRSSNINPFSALTRAKSMDDYE